MIDKTKIQKAAKEYCDAATKEAFIKGVMWGQKEFLESLWHHAASERPMRKTEFLVNIKNRDFNHMVVRSCDYNELEKSGFMKPTKWLDISELVIKN